MTSRTRFWVLVVSTPVIAFALIGGYLGQAMTRDETYRNLAIFGDVFDLVVDNYVEEVDVQKAMRGALRGLTDGLDADAAFLTPDLVRTFESKDPVPAGEIGVDVTRGYYLRIISVREGSPAAKAGLRTGDFIRAIDGRSTREMSAFEGARLLRGPVGSKLSVLIIRSNAPTEPHELALVRDRSAAADMTTRMANATTGYVRVAEFTPKTAAQLQQAIQTLEKSGASRFVVDVRGAARGDLDEGIAAARLFVKSGTLAVRQTKTGKETLAAQPADGALTAPVVLLVDQGTTGAAEIFAAALDGNNRADLVGDRTIGRAARQQLVRLADGSGLLLSSVRYLTPAGQPLQDKGLIPDVPIEQPDIEFGAEPPAGDPALEKAVERLAK
jgi:carboxyl-terminal processing protease